MKKTITAILLICTFITALLPLSAFAKTGDVIGHAKYTDISAYINHYPITSYNINDYTAVVAEDLQNYGFKVVWNGNARSLSITRNSDSTKITPYGTVYKYASKAGQNSFPYLETDIVTYVNGNKVESFNINGKTCVYIDSLAPYGKVAWIPETRAIKMWVDGLPQATYQALIDISDASSVSLSDLRTLLELLTAGTQSELSSLGNVGDYLEFGGDSFKKLFDQNLNLAISFYEEAYNIAKKHNETSELAYYINQVIDIWKSINLAGLTDFVDNSYLEKFKTAGTYEERILNTIQTIIDNYNK